MYYIDHLLGRGTYQAYENKKDKDGNKVFAFNGRPIHEYPSEEEIDLIIRDLESDNRKYNYDKEYSMSDFISSGWVIVSLLGIFASIFVIYTGFYSNDILKELAYAISLNDKSADHFRNMRFWLYFGLTIFSLFFFCFFFYHYNSNYKAQMKRNKSYQDIYKHFVNMKKDVENNKRYNHTKPIKFTKPPQYHYSGIEEVGIFNVMFFGLLFLYSVMITTTAVKYLPVEEYKGSGHLDTIHYIDEQYVIFHKENGRMNKLQIPSEIKNVIIYTDAKSEDEKQFKYYWREHNTRVLTSDEFNRNYYLEVHIGKDDYVKGSLLNKD